MRRPRSGCPTDHASIGVAAADFDADRHIDLFLTGVGDNRLLRNRDGKRFEDISAKLQAGGAASPVADGALARPRPGRRSRPLRRQLLRGRGRRQGISSIRKTPAAGLANSVYRNDGRPEPIPGRPEPDWAPLAVAVSDVKAPGRALDRVDAMDRSASTWPGRSPLTPESPCSTSTTTAISTWCSRPTADRPIAILNDRLGQFHEVADQRPCGGEPVSGLLVDRPRLGRSSRPGRRHARADSVRAWRNTTEQTTTAGRPSSPSSPGRSMRHGGARPRPSTSTSTACPTCSGCPPARTSPAMSSCRRGRATKGSGYAAEHAARCASEAPASKAWRPSTWSAIRCPISWSIRPGEAPALARNLGNGQHWLALQLGGHWRVKPELMRTNSHGIGTRVLARRAGDPRRLRPHDARIRALASRSRRSCWGWASSEKADLVHLRWPDGVMQCELNVAANQKLDLAENNRKTGSCPVLFTWNGRAVRLHRRLPGRRRPRLPGRPGRLQPARPRRGDRDHGRAAPAERRRLSALGHRADGRGRVSRSV